jgi:CubicO group peptidase (beta-lactamase class C family)
VASKVTIHHLLTHTSGIPDYVDDPFVVLKRTSDVSPSDLMALFMNEPLESAPGTRFSYSNSSYIVLGAIIEEVSGQSYEAFLHHRLLTPLGMRSSGYARRETGLPQRAEGYTIDEYQNLVNALPVSMSILHTAGALYSSVEDMLRWDQELYESKVLERIWTDKMLTAYTGNYGYGWFIDSLYGFKHLYHGGFLECTKNLFWFGFFLAGFEDQVCSKPVSNPRFSATLCHTITYEARLATQKTSILLNEWSNN